MHCFLCEIANARKKALFLYKGVDPNVLKKGTAPIKMKITVTEALELINEIREQPDNLFKIIRADVKQTEDRYITELMDMELTDLLGRKRYERIEGKSNHRNGFYPRNPGMFCRSN